MSVLLSILGWVIGNIPSLISAIVSLINLIHGMTTTQHAEVLSAITSGFKTAQATGDASALKEAIERYTKGSNVTT
jgi:hypothetical protein